MDRIALHSFMVRHRFGVVVAASIRSCRALKPVSIFPQNAACYDGRPRLFRSIRCHVC
jgi:hypothetical protein